MTEVKDVDRENYGFYTADLSVNGCNLSVNGYNLPPSALVIAPGGKEILRFKDDGTVVCADAVKANEAGRALVETLTHEWDIAVSGVRKAAEKAERDKIVAWLRGITGGIDPALPKVLADAIESRSI